jgi:hypothetical protein
MAAAAPPKSVSVTFPADFGFVPAGVDLKVRVDGTLPAAGKVGLFIRVFYRINGIPFANDLYNDAANSAALTFSNVPPAGSSIPDKTAPFTPLSMFHSVRALAWTRGATNGADVASVAGIRTKLTRFQGVGSV